MAHTPFAVEVLTPEGEVFNDEVEMLSTRTTVGSIGTVPWWFVAVVFGRDIYILLAVVGIILLTKVRRFPPSLWGKLSTFAQIVAAVAWMVTNIWPLSVLHAISSATLWVSAGFTVWSGTHYTLRGVQTLRAR